MATPAGSAHAAHTSDSSTPSNQDTLPSGNNDMAWLRKRMLPITLVAFVILFFIPTKGSFSVGAHQLQTVELPAIC
eukprot:4495161-Ditylum_brightwellii.AAC.1